MNKSLSGMLLFTIGLILCTAPSASASNLQLATAEWDSVNDRVLFTTNTSGEIKLYSFDAESYSDSIPWPAAPIDISSSGTLSDTITGNEPSAGKFRFYLLLAQDGDGGCDEVVFAFRIIELSDMGQDYLSLWGIPSDNKISKIFGLDLPSGATAETSTRITWFDAQSAGVVVDKEIWLKDLGGGMAEWQYYLGGSGSADDEPIELERGFRIQNPGTAQELHMVLKVPGENDTISPNIEGSDRFNVMSYLEPRRNQIDELNLITSGFTGGATRRNSDELRVLQKGCGDQCSPRLRAWFNTSDWTWRNYVTGGLIGNALIEPDEAIIIATDTDTISFNWDNILHYTPLSCEEGASDTFSIVRIDDRQIKVQKRLLPSGDLGVERPYFIEGVVWNPATAAPDMGPDPQDPLGMSIAYGFFTGNPEAFKYWQQQEFENRYMDDIPLITELNVNTVRLEVPLGDDGINLTMGKTILDELYDNDIMVIMTVANTKAELCDNINPLCADFCMGTCGSEASYVEVVNRFKDHPAILMWSIGNGWNYIPDVSSRFLFDDVDDAQALIDQAAGTIKSIDPNHPVTSALYDSPNIFLTGLIVWGSENIDIWGVNAYRGDSFGSLFDDWSIIHEGAMSVNGTIPIYLSEYGTDSKITESAMDDDIFNGGLAQDGRSYAVTTSAATGELEQLNYLLSLHQEIVQQQARSINTKFTTGGFVYEFNDGLYKVGNHPLRLNDIHMTAPMYDQYDENGYIVYGGGIPHPDCNTPFFPCTTNEEHFGILKQNVSLNMREKKPAFNELKMLFAMNTMTGMDIGYTDANTTITFAEIAAEGHTEITLLPSGPMPPFGFQVAGDYYEITTTAAYAGSIEVCINYGPGVPNESMLELLHYEDSAWVNVTSPGYPDLVTHTICGDVTSLSPFVIVRPNEPPTADAGTDQTVECTAETGTQVALDGSLSNDPDGDPLTFAWSGPFGTASGTNPTVTLPLGTHTITLTVNDGNGGSDTDTIQITVEDTTPPALSVSVDPDMLWPPNHKMKLITPTTTISDFCDTAPQVELTMITMDEGDTTDTFDPNYDESEGEGNTTNDIQIDPNGDIYLRAERAGNSDGRVYTITYTATDASGNSTSASATVTVPHNQ